MKMNDFELFLEDYFNNEFDSTTKEAMKYSLFAGGKRIRPDLLLSLVHDYEIDITLGFHAAAALEMIHTYSLIHDDLPAMDNDSLRRGKASNHIQFSESTAILAGDALLTEAFYCLSRAELEAKKIVELLQILSQTSGYKGMIYGQELDMNGETTKYQIDQIKITNYFKTGNLFIAALKMAAIIADKRSDISTLEMIGTSMGIAFQIHDDILEVIRSENELGKSKSDDINHKSTYLDLLGMKKSQEEMNYYYDRAVLGIQKLNLKSSSLLTLLDHIRRRQK